ncbi:hypothetical protein ACS0TY_021832 [Phlomoides rotata]
MRLLQILGRHFFLFRQLSICPYLPLSSVEKEMAPPRDPMSYTPLPPISRMETKKNEVSSMTMVDDYVASRN